MKKEIVKKIDAAIIIVALIAASAVSISTKDVAIFSAILLGAIAVHFLCSIYIELEFIEKEQNISKKIDDKTQDLAKILTKSEETILNSHKLTLTSFKGVKVTDIIQNVDLYIAEKIKNASKSVYDLNWQDYQKNTNPRNFSDRKYSENAIDESIKEFCTKGNVTYQEIFTFSDNRNYPKLQTHLNYGDNYSCSYYDNLEPLKKFPKIQFVIIDEKEVVFVSSAYGHSLCATRDEKIVEICCIYFKQAWDLSTKIKEEKTMHNNIIAEIETKYTV